MKKISLEIKALSPLAIGQKKPGGNISEVEDCIPGSVIRGAVASQILKQTNQEIEPDDDFYKLFLGGNPAIFQNAYPGDDKIKSEVIVIPATALSSKIRPGFRTKGDGVFDTLIDRFCAENHGQIYDFNSPIEGNEVEGDRVDNFPGFYSRKSSKYSKNSAKTRLLTRVGINRRRATSEERVLYSIEVLNESKEQKKEAVIYTSTILAPDDLANTLQTFIHNHQDNFRLGGASSRGLGKVKMTVKPPQEIESKFNYQIDKFNQKLRKRWDEWGNIFGTVSDLPANRIYFTIDLQADAILTENWQRTTVISETMLQQFTGVKDSSLQLHTAYSSYDYRSGWNAAWGLMKDVELVTNRGGVYLFSTDNKDSWLQAWEDLEVYGIGDRTSEGFGQVQICNEFHLVLREEAV
ncbi:CRISPR-associated RAMP protein Csx10 [Anabaena cylindrica FACHB-243]|uniref:CRISPR-associated RAMP protein, Csx10 family n=1 Tax=Anabaena cylindrica (strain ATCC 27899 / PCC 7122) TaxID=272123 RepID=K9ZLZ5_ANACC|nr:MULTISPECIES: CRISPR-associated RAMP protein Csx10 [Anabaena]AFZ59582.1 CRISPR-associated RAMP protein, Csx10 family [Anabaena cylindrica PCC 7122]MBD2418753.1 CRISPR-associated RAMP protein Csx10 [Anabaena cylindrica FACHB-243]MBY5281620.1 CRISPR-associated RAMP protein Csx10 [Anabaena sp. CCAP 1446/1C]MBY5309146.1 CRISPR-associated RAMP protein Csx10 [Anabaena sp. CCAP 1446/1C]MCM2406317.1 CRISPR-associated RAMP protein Csx10 [Anabaena sp. CCAP 1446/1C]